MIPVRQSNEICGNRAHLEARCIVCLRIKRRPSEARVEEQIGRLSRNEMRSVFIAWRTVPATDWSALLVADLGARQGPLGEIRARRPPEA
jgi:hypothetical protein